MSASLAMQRLMMAALAGVPGVSGVYDGPPAGAVAPYLTIGPDLVTDWSTKTETGHEHRVQVRVWDERDGPAPGTARLKPLMAAVEAALAGMAGEAEGHRLVSSRLVRALVTRDSEGWSEGLVEFRLRSRAMAG
ncbi:DUF3168 domain-containing protein [Polymorphobacter sp.]|uniref:DUF3168 domain-containing protein n=1 Tax=Polymorphobacter sp. TaxID=1909290 RepID=UPI003F7179E4